MKLPDSWIEARLGDVLHRVEAKVDPQRAIAMTHFYVGLEHIESHSGRLLRETEDVTDSTDILSIKTAFQSGDILYGKLRPNLNKVHLAQRDGICSTDIWVLRASDALNIEFGLHFLRSPAIYVRASQLAAGANLPRISATSFDRISFPLPTLPEQERIVDVLRQIEKITQLQEKPERLLANIKRQLFVEIFGDPSPRHNTAWPIVKLGSLVTVATGGTPSREKTDSYVGNIAWAKSTDLTDEAISSTEETISAQGVLHSNAKIHPKHTILLAMYGQGQTRGRTAKLLIDAACNQACAALLPSDELLPDYLWVWLQLSYEAVRSLGRGGQQENLNLDIVRSLKLPKPPLTLQIEFTRRLDQLLEVDKKIRLARKQVDELLKALSIEALTGATTANWRNQHSAEINAAAATRDALLHQRGAKPIARAPEPAPLTPASTPPQRPARQWLLDELSAFQRQVFAAFCAYPEEKQPILVEDGDVFANFCDDENVRELLKAFGPSLNNRIRRTLSQLSALGLIAKVTLLKKNTEIGQNSYLKAFRPLRDTEFTKLADMTRIRRAMKKTPVEKHWILFAHLDYGTSEGAGAGGMFQVNSLNDEDDNDLTHLVDQGVHYPSLSALKQDIARTLKVPLQQIDLEEV